MRFIVTKDCMELGNVMSQLMLKHMHSPKNRVNIAVTTGNTCIAGYDCLIPQIRNKDYFKNVHYYIFDEFWFKNEDKTELIPDCKISLDRKLFAAAGIENERIHNLDYENYKTFDEDILRDGGFELVIMGIGKNGHFCGNQPGTFASWNTGTRMVRTDATEYLRSYSRHLLTDDFHSDDEERIPEYYITMGPKTIMSSRNIIFILSGREKAEVAKRAFIDPVTMDYPASIFQMHPNVTVILDEAAAAFIKDPAASCDRKEKL